MKKILASIAFLGVLVPVSAFALSVNSSTVTIVNNSCGIIRSSTRANSSTGGNTAGGSTAGKGGSGGSVVSDGPSRCPIVTTTVVSDTTNLIIPASTFAAAVTFIHSEWTASIPGATWIWDEDPQSSPVVPRTVAFEKTFTVPGTVLSAILDIATDNTYTGKVNGIAVDNSSNPIGDANEDNFHLATQDSYNVLNAITSGSNTAHFEVSNAAGSTDPQANPAGLLYKLVVTSQDCGSNNNGGATGGNGGAGGSSGVGGTVQTGNASSTSGSVNTLNTTRVRIH